ncbi:hypothetical protein NQ314_018986 [Rhamnusium bicolor]|uniref:Uncharacterized protein n=1 Tax=Rhamnusium bicolor TaxID=1586634 RepID=A0AAV8WQN1_9CUCU|nr:hypothetical protein NQ314_018986 [Rhamnusium bicolor]
MSRNVQTIHYSNKTERIRQLEELVRKFLDEQEVKENVTHHVDFPSAIKELVKRHKLVQETWTEYYFGKIQLLRQCEKSSKNAVTMLIEGIPDYDIQSGAKVGHYVNPEDLYQEYLSTLNIDKRKNDETLSVRPQPNKFQKIEVSDLRTKFNYHGKSLKCFSCR